MNDDGLPDNWQDTYFTNAADSAATNDFDGDGVLNGDEFAAGTNPTDPLSFLRVDGLSMEPAPSILLKTSFGHEYRVLCAPDLMGTIVWTNFTDWKSGNGGYLIMTATNNVPFESYKVHGRLAVDE